jgi:hypothetical protein
LVHAPEGLQVDAVQDHLEPTAPYFLEALRAVLLHDQHHLRQLLLGELFQALVEPVLL